VVRLLLTGAVKPAIMAAQRENAMADDDKGFNLTRLALGAGVLAAAVGLAVFVPRRRWVAIAEPFRAALSSPVALAMTAWAVSLWNEATQSGPPVFNDLRPFDEF
jgi:hypothetical protein